VSSGRELANEKKRDARLYTIGLFAFDWLTISDDVWLAMTSRDIADHNDRDVREQQEKEHPQLRQRESHSKH
jgi:hypothetical protein